MGSTQTNITNYNPAKVQSLSIRGILLSIALPSHLVNLQDVTAQEKEDLCVRVECGNEVSYGLQVWVMLCCLRSGNVTAPVALAA